MQWIPSIALLVQVVVVIVTLLFAAFLYWVARGWWEVARDWRRPKKPAPMKREWTTKDYEDLEMLKRMNQQAKKGA